MVCMLRSEIEQLLDFLETFPGNFGTICFRFEIFGNLVWMESAMDLPFYFHSMCWQTSLSDINTRNPTGTMVQKVPLLLLISSLMFKKENENKEKQKKCLPTLFICSWIFLWTFGKKRKRRLFVDDLQPLQSTGRSFLGFNQKASRYSHGKKKAGEVILISRRGNWGSLPSIFFFSLGESLFCKLGIYNLSTVCFITSFVP